MSRRLLLLLLPPLAHDLLHITAHKLGTPTKMGQLKSYQKFKFMEETYADVYAKLEELPAYDCEDMEYVMLYSFRRFEINCMTWNGLTSAAASAV